MKKLMILCLSTIVLASCNSHITPSGNVITVERNVEGFSKVAVSHGLRATITMDVDESLKVTADDNLLQYIDTYVRGNTLIVERQKHISFRGSYTVNVAIGAVELTSVSGSGGSYITVANEVESADFDIDLSGGSRFDGDITSTGKVSVELSGGSVGNLTGSANSLTTKVSGGGRLGSYDFEAGDVVATLSGGSEARLTVNNTLKVTGSGGSRFYYKGNPEITSDLSGSSKIEKVD